MMKALYMMILLTISYAKEVPLDLNKTSILSNRNSDSLNFCLAVFEKDLKYCSKIKNKDEKSSCFGILQRNSGYCTMVVDKNIKYSCLSIALSDIEYCEKITDKKMKKSCSIFYIKNELDKKQDTCK